MRSSEALRGPGSGVVSSDASVEFRALYDPGFNHIIAALPHNPEALGLSPLRGLGRFRAQRVARATAIDSREPRPEIPLRENRRMAGEQRAVRPRGCPCQRHPPIVAVDENLCIVTLDARALEGCGET